MNKKGWTIVAVVTIVALFLVCCASVTFAFIAAGLAASPTASMGSSSSVAVIHVNGVIAASSDSGLLTGTTAATPESLIKQLRAADKDNRVAAILLRVDSPGGSAAASQEIYTEVKRMKKPVVVSIADVGASGAYYISCPADEIMASRASAVGSIGVIMQVANLQELYSKIGIKYQTIKQGKYKDMGSADRSLTAEEIALLDSESKEVYDQFIADVAESRELSEEKVRELATGQVWNGSKAKELGLIDSIGNYRDAVEKAGKLGKISGEPGVISYDEPSLWEILTNPSSASGLSSLNRVLNLLDRSALPASSSIPR